MASRQPEPNVCDIIGAWGRYQTSVAILACAYTALHSMTLGVGPLWTQAVSFGCNQSVGDDGTTNGTTTTTTRADIWSHQLAHNSSTGVAIEDLRAKCTHITGEKCTSFFYDERHGKFLTNTVSRANKFKLDITSIDMISVS